MSVYVWDANSHGQLGLGFESELCMSPQFLTNKCSFMPASARCIRGLVVMCFFCTSLGECMPAVGIIVANWGWIPKTSVTMSLNVCRDVCVESIACGWDISGCITATKRLFVWGSNSFQQLGIYQRGFNAVRRPLPVTLPRGDTAKRINFDMRHCAILTEDG